MAKKPMNIGQIIDHLSGFSNRPRYAYAVLTLLAEQAGPGGKVGPYVIDEGTQLPLRQWVGRRWARISGRSQRRRALEARIRKELEGQLPDDLFEAQKMIDEAVERHVRATGADNFSRVIGELEKAGYVKRIYEGYRTNHANRGGLRHLACILDADVSAALRRRDLLV